MTDLNKTVTVFGRASVEKISAIPNAIFISISSPDRNYTNKISGEGWLEFLPLEFHDFVEPEHAAMCPNFIMFDKSMGEKIIALLTKHRDAPIIVHCDAGQSRSVAVGAFIRDFFGYSLYLNETPNDNSRNIHVYNVLRRLFLGV